MGLFDKLKRQATRAVDQHGDKIAEGLDRAAQEADRRTGGKHSPRIAKGRDQAKDRLDALDGRNDDIPPSPRRPR